MSQIRRGLFLGSLLWIAAGAGACGAPEEDTGVPSAPGALTQALTGGVEGIDVGTSQKDADFAAVKTSGVAFSIVKAGGGNVGLYVAPYYTQQLTRARAAGLKIGHYWFNGNKGAAAEADYFNANVRYQPGDILALDIEAEPANGIAAYTPAQALEFCRRVEARFGVKPYVYMSASYVRSQDWRAVAAAGYGLWVAVYGSNTGTPGAAPEIDDWADWSIWQYTSNGTVPGVPGRVDRNYAKASVFGGGPGPGPGPSPGDPGPLPITGVRDTQTAAARQQWLKNIGLYSGPADGVWGVNTNRGWQQFLKNQGLYSGPVDGVPGPNTMRGWQIFLGGYGYTGPADGVEGPNTIRAEQRFLNTVL